MAFDFTGWYRVGQGRSFQFDATDQEIAEWLVKTLPNEFAPYVVFREEWVHPKLIVHESRIEDLGRSFSQDRSARHWIKSERLSPGLKPDDISVPNDLGQLSFSGLISIRLGEDRNGRREGADLGMIDRIRHERTGEELRQTDYLKIFERLRRSAHKR